MSNLFSLHSYSGSLQNAQLHPGTAQNHISQMQIPYNNHIQVFLFYFNISSTISDCQCKMMVRYLWSCVCNPPVGAGTWPLRLHSEDRWGWGRRAAEGGTTQRCWWGLVDVGERWVSTEKRKQRKTWALIAPTLNHSIMGVATTWPVSPVMKCSNIVVLFYSQA